MFDRQTAEAHDEWLINGADNEPEEFGVDWQGDPIYEGDEIYVTQNGYCKSDEDSIKEFMDFLWGDPHTV